jgi:hypothetical protein
MVFASRSWCALLAVIPTVDRTGELSPRSNQSMINVFALHKAS